MFLFAVTAGCFLVCGLKWSPPPGMWFWGRRAPTEEKTGKKNMTGLIFWLAIDRSQNPPTLSYCCHDDKQCRSHTTHYVLTQWKIHRRAKRKLTTHRQRRQSRLLLIWNKVSGPSAFKLSHFKRNSNNKYHFVALQCVETDRCIASVQTREPIVFSYLLKARNEHE